MQLTAARDELAARGFDGLDPGRMNLFLNAGKNSLEGFAPWPWLEASTSGPAPLTIADLKTILHVWNSNLNLSLDGQQRTYLRTMFGPDLTIVGTGRYWYLTGTTVLNVFPVDTSTLNVDYLCQSPELSADDDEPLWPDLASLNNAWIDYAVVEAYMDADEGAMAESTRTKAENTLTRLLDQFFDRNHQNAERQPLTFASEDW